MWLAKQYYIMLSAYSPRRPTLNKVSHALWNIQLNHFVKREFSKILGLRILILAVIVACVRATDFSSNNTLNKLQCILCEIPEVGLLATAENFLVVSDNNSIYKGLTFSKGPI